MIEIALPGIGAVLGVAALRRGWGGPRPWIVAGWTLIALALVILTATAGAWGLAVGASAAMAAAMLVLARAGIAEPGRETRSPRAMPTVTPPRWRWRGLARRIAVFLLIVPVGLVASAILAFGCDAIARRAGWVEADSLALALFVQPVVWAILATVQSMKEGPVRMISPALICAAIGLLLWWPL
ncbi:MAG TPA: hypothetical protein VM657_07145 [Sphingomonas sp.]|nr:hypothetical protein [Sphingomonas sp.]